MEGVRSAASFEGLIALAVIYFLLNLIGKAGKKRGTGAARPLPPPEPGRVPDGTQQEGFSLEAVLREIERVKHEAEKRSAPPLPAPAPHTERPRFSAPPSRPKASGKRPRQLPSADRPGRPKDVQDERGPLGRHSRTRLPSAEEMEERESLESGSLEVAGRLENLDEARQRPRVEFDQDEGAEELVQRRIQQAEARNREFSAQDHRRFHEQLRQGEEPQTRKPILTTQQLRQAFVWREILGPPKSLE